MDGIASKERVYLPACFTYPFVILTMIIIINRKEINMANSLLASLFSMLDQRGLREISDTLGESEHSVSSGMQSSIAAVLGSIASKAGEPTALRKTLDLLPSGSGNVVWSNVVESASHPQSPLIAEGKRLLSGLFGSSESTVMRSVSTDPAYDLM